MKTTGACPPWNLSTVPTRTPSAPPSPADANRRRTSATWALYGASTSTSEAASGRVPCSSVHGEPSSCRSSARIASASSGFRSNCPCGARHAYAPPGDTRRGGARRCARCGNTACPRRTTPTRPRTPPGASGTSGLRSSRVRRAACVAHLPATTMRRCRRVRDVCPDLPEAVAVDRQAATGLWPRAPRRWYWPGRTGQPSRSPADPGWLSAPDCRWRSPTPCRRSRIRRCRG